MGIGPPKCRTCGVAEWRHLCNGRGQVAEVVKAAEKTVVDERPRKPRKKTGGGANSPAIPPKKLVDMAAVAERVRSLKSARQARYRAKQSGRCPIKSDS